MPEYGARYGQQVKDLSQIAGDTSEAEVRKAKYPTPAMKSLRQALVVHKHKEAGKIKVVDEELERYAAD